VLSSLLAKAKKATFKYWKWILGVIVALLVFFAIWRMKRLKERIAKLEAERDLFGESVKDMRRSAQSEKNSSLAKALKDEAELLEAGVMEHETEIMGLTRDLDNTRKAVNDAKTWAELRRLAGSRK